MAETKSTPMCVEPHDSTSENDVIMESGTSLAPVIIEELDQNTITWMDVDMTEFVEAEALEIQEIGDNNMINSEQKDAMVTSTENLIPESTDDQEESDRFHVDEEDRLTKQFLNGELTFSEYSLRMDEGIETEIPDIESNRKAFETELVASKKIGQKKAQKTLNTSQQRPNRRKKRTLPTALQGLMGEANLRFARGEVSLASKMCMEIIRQVPSAPEPFHTLSMIYENDQPEKSLQFALIAAHLSPREADQWIKLATLSMESGNIRQTITCFTKAIQASPKDINLYKQRAKLQNQIGDKKGALKGYMKLLHHLGPEDGANILKYAKSLAKHFMQENNNEQALEAMDQLFTKCPDLITLEEVNVMTELLIALKRFHKCLHILTRYTTIKITYKDQSLIMEDEGSVTKENHIIESCELPNDVVMDLKAKFLITLVELNETKWTDIFLPRFLTEVDPEVSGDLFLDLAEAFMGKKKFHKALQLLEPLIESKNFSLAAVWLRHAECWVGCKNLKRAVNSYEMVRELSPQHLGARLELAKLYKLRGLFNKAIEVLKQDPETDLLDPGVVYQRTVLLLKVKRYNEYFQSGMLLLSRHCVSLRSKAELITLTKATGVKQRLDALQLYRLSRGETFEDENAPCFREENQPSLRNEFSLYLQMCQLACKKKRQGLFQRLAFGAMTSKRFEKKSSHITFLCLISCIHNNDSYHGYNIVRELVRVCRRSNSWNLMNIIIQRAEDCRHNRFIMRLLGRVEGSSYLHLLHANNCLVSGTYKYALNDYVSLFKVEPSALLALLISVTLLQMACQRFSVQKNQLVIQALAFLTKYSQMRGKGGEHETSYNTARAFHQLGLLPAAIHHYKLVLETPPPILVSQKPHLLDLTREAAFNLHLIYLESGNEDLARMYLEEYITVTMTLTLASKVKFIEFCTILDEISKARAATKSSYLECLIKQCREFSEKLKKKDKEADTSFFPILRLLLPQHDRERGAYGLKETALAKLYVRVLALGQTSKDAQELLHYKVPISGKQSGGDFAEIAYSILYKRGQIQESSMTVEQVNTILDNIAEKNASNSSKDGEFQKLIQQLSAVEQKWLIRILLKDLRFGLSQKKILNAYHSDAVELFDVSMSLRDVCDKLQNAGIGIKYQIEIFSPFKPMLLERCKIDDVGKFFTNQESHLVETKHDGERFQLHMKDGLFSYFSRNAYNFTEAYGKSKSSGLLTGKIAKLLNPSCRSIILDGEMMGWHKVHQRFGSKGMSFDVKKMTPTSTHQPCFIAFDVIMYNEKLLVDEPLTERLKVLKEAFVEETGVLVRSQTRIVSSKVELLDAFNKSMDTSEEGIVLKKCNSTYKPGVRVGSDCYKIKAEYSADLVEDMDLVIVGGYYGEGRMRGRINSFLVAVAHSQNPETTNDLKFHAVSSVRTGIKIEAFEELLLTLEPHWVKKCPDNVVGPKKDPPNLWIEPKNSIVLKLRATELVRSSSYPTGYSLRFPRVVAIRGRDEKSWRECCTTEEFHSLVKGPGVIQKLTKRHVTEHDVMKDLPAKSPRKTKDRTITVLNYNPSPTTAVARISRLLDDKEICVVNGNNEMSKEDVEKIVREHGGSIVQHPGGKTFCAIVGNANKLRVKNMIQGQKYNVVNLEWLLRATRPENFASLQPWLPWELLFATESTRSRMSTVFDDTYDSYAQDTNIDDLKRSLERAAELAKDSELTNDQYKEIDRELFGHETSPFSVFRGSVGYFCTSDKQRNLEFRFMGGAATGILDNHVTHIFASKNSNIPAEIRRLEAGESATKVLDEQWIADCFRERKLLPETEYSIQQNTTNSCWI